MIKKAAKRTGNTTCTFGRVTRKSDEPQAGYRGFHKLAIVSGGAEHQQRSSKPLVAKISAEHKPVLLSPHFFCYSSLEYFICACFLKF